MQDEDKVTLEEFIINVKWRLQEFEDFYKEQHQENPDEYPLSMTGEDWDEKFLLFN